MSSKVTYRQQYTRCGKQRCRKCREGAGHGPYWYAYWSENGRTISKYIGMHRPTDTEAANQSETQSPPFHQDTFADQAVLPGPPQPVLRIYLLGQFRVERRTDNEWLSALLPELRAILPQIGSSPPLPHEQERLHLWEATLDLFSALSHTAPLLLVLDDLHWADERRLYGQGLSCI